MSNIDVMKIFEGLINRMFPPYNKWPLSKTLPLAIEAASRDAEKHPYVIQSIIDKNRSSVDSIIARAVFAFPKRKALYYRIEDARVAVGRRFYNAYLESYHPDLTRVEATAVCIAALYSHEYLNASELSFPLGRYF